MRWPFVLGIALLTGFLGTGCPEVYGKRGSLDDAMAEDMEEQQDERRRESGKDVPCRGHKRRVWECDDENRPETCDWKCR
ncbi:hypothetical protein [Archangium lansingense]|uniref:Lipoprotein n=1 Tax=Archangium lansingense TaxID=2995310 RepID=A0ABT3ZXM6_9BACT|nr:hypothetical protein [Archangium lansinium]MCY1074148.1 hypothetical protein [Archangium lansinium]